MSDYTFELTPVADPAAVVRGDKWRFTVLTDRLIRMEYDKTGRFNDSATLAVICRRFPVPEFTVTERGGVTEISTAKLRLFYDGGEFSPEGLRIELKEPIHAFASCWRYGDRPRDLGGTARTLDGADGAVKLESGIMSSDGFTVYDDSTTALLGGDLWASPREGGAVDMYFFAYGHDYMGALRDFYRLSGEVPLLPRFTLGNWWSRYHVYTEDTYLKLMDDFAARGIPLSVAVVDMDWHLTKLPPNCGSGWTGYTWNRELFPDPERFLRRLHDMGLKVTLNVHPAEGVGAHERAYRDMAEALGIDPEGGQRIPFEATDREYMDAYFKYLHHPLENEGVDFWWVDWQQGERSAVRGIDPLWVLNHLHYLDSGRDGRWPLTFSRYAGVGSHRYPIGFSGDTCVSWESLDFQPYFTATASNVGYTWWSHDIGGHMGGRRDDELTARWVELGVFSPIMRLHSTSNDFTGKEPWKYGAEAERAMVKFMRLRRALIPYLYSMNYLTHLRGLPLVRPMYYDDDGWDAYGAPNEYHFGTQMIACPITKPVDRETLMAPFDGWLPKGEYYDFFNGRRYTGGRRIRLYRTLDAIPVLVPAGGIIPLDADETSNGCANPELIELRVYPGADGSFDMYEDSGVFGAEPAVTHFELKWGERALLRAAVTGDAGCIPETRRYRVTLIGVETPEGSGWSADKDSGAVAALVEAGRGGFELSFPGRLKKPEPLAELFDILTHAQIGNDLKMTIYGIMSHEESLPRALAALELLNLRPEVYGALTEPFTAGA